MQKNKKIKKSEAQPKKQEKTVVKEIRELKEQAKEEEKKPEKSRLESDLGEEQIDTQKMMELLNPRVRSSPKADVITDFGTPEFSQGLGAGFARAGKKEEIKYETIKNLSEDYKDIQKRADMDNPEKAVQFASPAEINMMSIGRGSVRMGREAQMITPQELTQNPESIRHYDGIAPSAEGKFQGEKTAFQQNLDKRYELMKK